MEHQGSLFETKLSNYELSNITHASLEHTVVVTYKPSWLVCQKIHRKII